MTHYEVLQVSEFASQDVIEAAWKALLLVHHPDKGGNAKKASQINQAHSILKDPEKRQEYDTRLAFEKLTKSPQGRMFRMPSPQEIYPQGNQAYGSAYGPAVNVEHVMQEMLRAGASAGMEALSSELRKNPFIAQMMASMQTKRKKKA